MRGMEASSGEQRFRAREIMPDYFLIRDGLPYPEGKYRMRLLLDWPYSSLTHYAGPASQNFVR